MTLDVNSFDFIKILNLKSLKIVNFVKNITIKGGNIKSWRNKNEKKVFIIHYGTFINEYS